jgi:hypothetical protein
MAILQQKENTSTIFIGWYGKCEETGLCSDFSLITENVRNKLEKVYQVKSTNDNYISFDPTIPSELDFSSQPFLNLECGRAYIILLKPGTSSINIPNFEYTKVNSDSKQFMTSDCILEFSECTFELENLTSNTFDFVINLNSLRETSSTNGFLQSVEIEFSGITLNTGDIQCDKFIELQKKYLEEQNMNLYEAFYEFNRSLEVTQNSNEVYSKLIFGDFRVGATGISLQDLPNKISITIPTTGELPHWRINVKSANFYDSSEIVSTYEFNSCKR